MRQSIRQTIQPIQPFGRRIRQTPRTRCAGRDPVRSRVHFLRRQIQVSRSDVFHREEFEFLEADDLMRYMDFAMIVRGRGLHGFQDLTFV